jgi:hypothetical protein
MDRRFSAACCVELQLADKEIAASRFQVPLIKEIWRKVKRRHPPPLEEKSEKNGSYRMRLSESQLEMDGRHMPSYLLRQADDG